MRVRQIVCGMIFIFLCAVALAAGEDRYFNVPLAQLQVTEGHLPTPDEAQSTPTGNAWRNQEWLQPYAVLDGAGEVYLPATRNDGMAGDEPWMYSGYPLNRTLAIRAPEGAPLSGRLYMPKPDWSGMMILRFKLPESAKPDPAAKTSFDQARNSHFNILAQRPLPGALWFRHQAQKGKQAGTTVTMDQNAAGFSDLGGLGEGRRGMGDLDSTLDLFTGGQALSENLQLDRQLRVTGKGEETVEIASLTGITVQPFDWKALLPKEEVALDPLAALIPADQHALFFPSFSAMLQLMDEAEASGTPILQLIEPRSEDARTRERYQQQLCLATDQLSRLLGPSVISAVAFTGADPYLRTGSDVAVLFQSPDPAALTALLQARRAQALAGEPNLKPEEGTIEEVTYSFVRTSDLRISSYLARVGDAVVVANSLPQLTRIVRVFKKAEAALNAQDEYRFFRSRYKRGDADETALLILSDTTIRRWCGPQWRIGCSRRVRAAAALAELQARRLDAIAGGSSAEAAIKAAGSVEGAGEISWNGETPYSSTYGSLQFLKPIDELDLKQVTKSEADAYARFRDTYQSNWRQFFDPIAVRFGVAKDKISLDLTVMPLILGSEYREFMALTAGAKIAPGAGDPHPGTLAHLALAVNPEAGPLRQAGQFIQPGPSAPGGMAAPTNPLGWIGGSLALYADDDPIWQQFVDHPEMDRSIERFANQLPVAINIASRDALRLAAFLTAVRAMADNSAPGLAEWTRLDYNGAAYMRVSAHEGERTSETLSIYYAATPKALILSLREDVLKRAMDRMAAAKAANAPAPQPWPGDQMALLLGNRGIRLLRASASESYEQLARERAWANLPILNEWHRRFAAADPVVFHEKLWQARLIDPAGGKYVWNDEWQTMESTVFGHPGQPKTGGELPAALQRLDHLETGVTFEHGGLRAKAIAHRTMTEQSK